MGDIKVVTDLTPQPEAFFQPAHYSDPITDDAAVIPQNPEAESALVWIAALAGALQNGFQALMVDFPQRGGFSTLTSDGELIQQRIGLIDEVRPQCCFSVHEEYLDRKSVV